MNCGYASLYFVLIGRSSLQLVYGRRCPPYKLNDIQLKVSNLHRQHLDSLNSSLRAFFVINSKPSYLGWRVPNEASAGHHGGWKWRGSR